MQLQEPSGSRNSGVLLHLQLIVSHLLLKTLGLFREIEDLKRLETEEKEDLTLAYEYALRNSLPERAV